MNQTATALKKAVQSYYANAVATANAIEQNAEKMPPDMAEYENRKLTENLKAEREKVDARIMAIGDAALDRLKKWAEPHGESLTADAKLLEYGVTPEQFAALANKHRNNATMAGILNAYARRENDKAGKPLYNTAAIPTYDDRFEALKKYMNGANDLLNMIDNGGKYERGQVPVNKRPMAAAAVDAYGESIPELDSLII